ncbi:hypothetical protein J6590_013525 [Homalodisca vitripennis]|nr:hypothetical protein J6590_013525 [Homalodisca vitripennis]
MKLLHCNRPDCVSHLIEGEAVVRHVTVEAGCHTCVYGLGLALGLLRAACGFCASHLAMGCTPSTHKKRGSRDDQSTHAHQLINSSGECATSGYLNEPDTVTII